YTSLGVALGGTKTWGNRIGTPAAGRASLPNAAGIRVSQCTAPNHIGDAGGENLISGNTGNGVRITNASAGQVIQANLIGAAADGTTPLGNGVNGIYIDSSNYTLVGGPAPNLIAHNARSGVVVVKTAVGNTISGNQIFGNVFRGIDLGDDGFTPNHPGGAATGPNDLQSFPDLTPLLAVGATAAGGALNSTPSTPFTLPVVSNATRARG